jgi:hypothetical protein
MALQCSLVSFTNGDGSRRRFIVAQIDNESYFPFLTVSRKTIRAPSMANGDSIDESIVSVVPTGKHRTIIHGDQQSLTE